MYDPLAPKGPERVVFVVGAPRSGTSLTHALLCATEEAGDYHPESVFLRGFFFSYMLGVDNWQTSTAGFFDQRDEFHRSMRKVTGEHLARIWRRLNRPRILVLKDPNLTPMVRAVDMMLSDVARFVVVCRAPEDVVRSVQNVKELQGQAYGLEQARQTAGDYLRYYRAVLRHDFGDRMMMVRYETLDQPRVHARLSKFIGASASPDLGAMWRRSDLPLDDRWTSPKNLKPIDVSPRLSPLPPAWVSEIRSICAPVLEPLGYAQPPLVRSA